jgi:hypothetical protein
MPVFATVQRKQGDPKPEFKVQRGPVMHLTVVSPAERPDTSPTSTAHRAACRVDLSVFIPDKSPLWIETARGSMIVKGIREPVLANSTSGLIEIFADGPVNAVTKSGDIAIVYRSASRWTRDMRLTSATGNIAVRMPRPADCVVRAQAGGDLTSDFSTRVEQPVDSRVKTATIRVADTAKGTRGFWSRAGRRIVHPFRRTPRLTIQSELGSVKVLRAPPGWIGTQEETPVDEAPAPEQQPRKEDGNGPRRGLFHRD